MNCLTVKVYKTQDGFVYADGIKIGKLQICDNEPYLELCDKDQRRSSERGTRFVLVRIADLQRLLDTDPPPNVLTK